MVATFVTRGLSRMSAFFTYFTALSATPVCELINERREQGWTLRAIANHLNGLNLRTRGGARWYASSARSVLLQTGVADKAVK